MAVTRDIKTDILDATLTVIINEGVRGTTYRRVADQAGLSPGTLTYHFPQTDLLLMGAFSYMVDTISQAFRQRMQSATECADACEAVVDLICGEPAPSDPEFRALLAGGAQRGVSAAAAAVDGAQPRLAAPLLSHGDRLRAGCAD